MGKVLGRTKANLPSIYTVFAPFLEVLSVRMVKSLRKLAELGGGGRAKPPSRLPKMRKSV